MACAPMHGARGRVVENGRSTVNSYRQDRQGHDASVHCSTTATLTAFAVYPRERQSLSLLLFCNTRMSRDFAAAQARALKNIIAYGDTDVFPFPFEKHLFEDKFEECANTLLGWHASFSDTLGQLPPISIDALSQVGYTGFRNVTQIEPFWNAYYLALVVSLAEAVEAVRVPVGERAVFSYRYNPKTEQSSLFQNITWNDYRKRCVQLAKRYEYVVLTDISDFYPRINHHRLENALTQVSASGDIPSRILRLLSTLSYGQSYGLPVGGPASRVLSELSLVDVDRHLCNTGISFCRYADDFTLFCSSRPAALKSLIGLSEILSLEGLSLQKQKTRIMGRAEFLQMHSHLDPSAEGSMEQKLLGISLKFDPYSPTAEDDYLALKASVADIDIIGILSSEIAKTAINQTVTRQALNALRVLDVSDRERSLMVLLAEENVEVLAPVFPHLMRIVRSIYDDLGGAGKDLVDAALLSLIGSGSHILSIDINRLFLVQVLSRRHTGAKERALVALHLDCANPLLRRMVGQALANWDCRYFVKKQLRIFSSMSPWERRALLVSSFCLGEEGRHWRRRSKATLDPIEQLICSWASERKQAGRLVAV